ncbi:hypothetical protein [Isoptericola rhizosphaerae]|uniref:hypothetical protein n=1 Tax=Isoptericola rhizosphaerae TaxID=3377837 RepID=UPI00383B98F5
MTHTMTRRRLQAAFAVLVVAPALTACSFSVGEIEPVGEDAGASESAAADSGADAGTDTSEEPETAEAPATTAELTTIHAQHVAARIPSDWEEIGDADGWSYVHQLSNESGGVAGRIGFMPGGAEMSAQESIDWFIGEVEGQGVTDENYAPVTTLRDEEDRANTSYTYTSGGEQYVSVVWALVDGNGIPSLVQLSGANDVITQDFVATIDQSLNLNGDWKGAAG